jgi:hypothetical protein
VGTDIKIWGYIRGILQNRFPKQRRDQQVHFTEEAEALIAYGSSSYNEIVRQRGYQVRTVTAVAAVTAIPTTAVALAIWNGEPDGGRSYIIDEVWSLITTDAVAAQKHAGIIANLGQTRVSAPTTAGLVAKDLAGMGSPGGTNPGQVDSRVYTITNTTVDSITGVAANWFPIGGTLASAVVSLPGYQMRTTLDGRYIVPPGRYFCVHTLADTTSVSAQMGIIWHEKLLTLG